MRSIDCGEIFFRKIQENDVSTLIDTFLHHSTEMNQEWLSNHCNQSLDYSNQSDALVIHSGDKILGAILIQKDEKINSIFGFVDSPDYTKEHIKNAVKKMLLYLADCHQDINNFNVFLPKDYIVLEELEASGAQSSALEYFPFSENELSNYEVISYTQNCIQKKFAYNPVKHKFESFDLGPIERKLTAGIPDGGYEWPEADTKLIIEEYRNFLLRTFYGFDSLVKSTQKSIPSPIVDIVWHTHILYTKKYMRDCDQLFGHYLHHSPKIV